MIRSLQTGVIFAFGLLIAFGAARLFQPSVDAAVLIGFICGCAVGFLILTLRVLR